MRKQPLNTGDIYHVFTKSIAGFRIFRTKRDYRGLVESPEEWPYSSYAEYIGSGEDKICNTDILSDINPTEYRAFVEARMDYQKEISHLKDIFLE